MGKDLKDLSMVIASISGGRDSTAMLLKCLENGEQIDYIIFNDTLQEIPIMYEYLQKVNKYISEKYNKSIIFTKPLATFEHWVFGKLGARSKKKGAIRGIPKKSEACWWRRESKIYPAERFYKAIGIDIKDEASYTRLIGFTKSEEHRAKDTVNERYPLIEWNWCEGDVDHYLESIEMTNPLYEYFSRTGCGMCPYMSLRGYYIVWKFFPKTWRYMKKIERKLFRLQRKGIEVNNCTWHDRYTLIELEHDFKTGKKEYDDTPAKECLCAI